MGLGSWMMRRCAPLSLLLLMWSCNADPDEQALRVKWSDHDNFVTTNTKFMAAQKWHSRSDCPSLAEESKYGVSYGTKPFPSIIVHTNTYGVFDANGIQHPVFHCPQYV